MGDAITNHTLMLVRHIEGRYGQSEQMATVELGVSIGITASLAVLFCVSAVARAPFAFRKRGRTPKERAHKTRRVPAECDADTDAEIDADNERRNTEGAYRSASESEEEGEVAKQEESRVRRATGV